MLVNGFGSIVQADKTKSPYLCRKWLLQVSTTNGRKSKRFTGTKREAQKELDNFITLIENDQLVKIRKFEDYVAYYLDYRKRSNRYSPNTLLTDKKAADRLLELFPNKDLTQIKPYDIRMAFLNIPSKKDPNKEVSGTMKRKYFFTLNSILNMALDDELIERNPCAKVPAPKRDTKKKFALNKQELNKLYYGLEHEPFDGRIMFIYFLVLLGLRRGEAVGLTWDNWNKENNTITIEKALKEADSSIGSPKSKAGYRTLPLPEKLSNKLYEWEKICKENLIESEWICCNTWGRLMTGGACYKWWRNFKNKYDLPDINYHGLRHTNLTIVSRYMTPFDLRDYAGWSDLKPASIYIHKNQDSMKRAIAQIDY